MALQGLLLVSMYLWDKPMVSEEELRLVNMAKDDYAVERVSPSIAQKMLANVNDKDLEKQDFIITPEGDLYSKQYAAYTQGHDWKDTTLGIKENYCLCKFYRVKTNRLRVKWLTAANERI